MGRSENRVGWGSVCTGMVIGLAVALLLIAPGAALAATFWDLDVVTIQHNSEVCLAWIGLALVIGTYIGGRSAAVSARLMVRRDGALAGLTLWAAMTLMLVAILVAWIAVAPGVAWRFAARPDVALWSGFALLLVTLVSGLAGGVGGARAEARSIGLRSVHVAKGGFVADPETYERDFFASSSLSTTPSTQP